VQRAMALLLVTQERLRTAVFTTSVECSLIQRFGVFVVAPHRSRADQRWFGLAILEHFDGPAVVIFVLDHACHPAGVVPQAVFADRHRSVRRGGFRGGFRGGVQGRKGDECRWSWARVGRGPDRVWSELGTAWERPCVWKMRHAEG